MNLYMFEIQAEFCKAMGNTVRLQILHVLRDHPLTVGGICRETDLSLSSVSRNLAVLRRMGVVTSRRHGAEVIYQISDGKVVEICDLVRLVLVEKIQKHTGFMD